MKFSYNQFLIYPTNESKVPATRLKIVKCTLSGHLYPSYFGWRIYWEMLVATAGDAVLLTEGPIGFDYPHLGFLATSSWIRDTPIGSDRGQLIVEVNSTQESGDNLSMHWGGLKRREINLRCTLPHESNANVAIAAKCFFGGLSCDLALLGSAMAQIPKKWDVQYRNVNGRVVIYPVNFDALARR